MIGVVTKVGKQKVHKKLVILFLISCVYLSGCEDANVLQPPDDSIKPKTVVLDSSAIDSPIGWIDSSSNKTIKVKITTHSNEVYECRIGHVSEIAGKSFSTCKPDASGFVKFDQPTSGIKNGTFEVQVRSVSDGKKSAVTSSDQFYVHDSLNEVALCSLPENDSHYFNIASQYLDQSLVYESDTSLKNPFIKLSFPVVAAGNYLFPDGSITDVHPGAIAKNYELRSLRKLYKMNSSKTLMLIKRKYVNRFSASNCTINLKNLALDGTNLPIDMLVGGLPPTTSDPDYARLWLQNLRMCDVVVMNAQRKFVCFSGAELYYGSKAGGLLKERFRSFGDRHFLVTQLTSSKFTANEQAQYDAMINQEILNGNLDAEKDFIFLEE